MTDELTRIEDVSIREFVQSAADEGYLSGDVLDYGCGRMPYRRIVLNAGGKYRGYDHSSFPANRAERNTGKNPFVWPEVDFDAILCTQVLQFIPLVRYGSDPTGSLQNVLTSFRLALTVRSGHLVLTYGTNWPEVNEEDLHRFTKMGMERLLDEAGFEKIVKHERREIIHELGYDWALGYGVVARA